MAGSITYSYLVFGLTVHSEIELPELIQSEIQPKPDISIALDNVDPPGTDLPNAVYRQGLIYSSEFFYLHLKDRARFIVDNNRIIGDSIDIRIDIINKAEMPTIMSWLYGSVLTAALQMKDRFALHASAVLVNERLNLFCGPSGIGKSTIAAQLHSRGYNIFTDDKCVLGWNGDKEEYFAEPSIQIMRLWEDAVESLGDNDFLNEPTPVVNRMNKYQYIVNKDEVITERKPIDRIYVIKNMTDDHELEITEPKGYRKVKLLQNQTHRKNYLAGLGKTKTHWDYMDKLVQLIPVQVIWRPKSTSIHDFTDFVEHSILERIKANS